MHPYCGTELVIPPVNTTGYSLATVLVVVRHGARAPGKKYRCWEGDEGFAWHCERPALSMENGGGLRFSLFYSGSVSPLGKNSTCFPGQVLDRGRDQERSIGKALRKAYAGSNAEVGFLMDEALPLFGSPGLKLRSSSVQRAIVSGQEILSGLFAADAASDSQARPLREVFWEVAPKETDWIYANPTACPRLKELSAAAEAAHMGSPSEATADAQARQEVIDAVGEGDVAGLRGNPALDCLMCSACGGADDPSIRLPVGLQGPVFDSTWGRVEAAEAATLTYQDNAFSRLAMGPLGWDLLQHLKAIQDGLLGTPRLALWSGHDTTIMPLLAALGAFDGHWAPYASSAIFEIWRTPGAGGGNPAPGTKFRLLHDGKVITSRIAGCSRDAQLCNLTFLIAAVEPWAVDEAEWRNICARKANGVVFNGAALPKLSANGAPPPSQAAHGARILGLAVGLMATVFITALVVAMVLMGAGAAVTRRVEHGRRALLAHRAPGESWLGRMSGAGHGTALLATPDGA